MSHIHTDWEISEKKRIIFRNCEFHRIRNIKYYEIKTNLSITVIWISIVNLSIQREVNFVNSKGLKYAYIKLHKKVLEHIGIRLNKLILTKLNFICIDTKFLSEFF